MRKINNAPRMFIELEVHDKNGKLIKRYKKEGHSWVGNLFKMICCMARGGTTFSAYEANTGSSSDMLQDYTGGYTQWALGGPQSDVYVGMLAGANEDRFGILVGSNDTPVSLSDFNLGSRISNSVLTHGATSLDGPYYGNTYYFTLTRQFTNNSGSTVTVKEMGLFFSRYTTFFLFARDVISPSIDIPNGGTLTCRYRIEQSLT